MSNTERFIEDLIQQGILSPAAREMDPQAALDQHNDAHALTPEDADFLVHPDVAQTTFEVDGHERAGWGYRGNPHVSADTPDVNMLRGCDKLSRELGALIFG